MKKNIRNIIIVGLVIALLLVGCISGIISLFKWNDIREFNSLLDSLETNVSEDERARSEKMDAAIRPLIQDTIPEGSVLASDFTYCYYNAGFFGEYRYLLEHPDGTKTTHKVAMKEGLNLVCEAYRRGYIETFPSLRFEAPSHVMLDCEGYLFIDMDNPDNSIYDGTGYLEALYDELYLLG